MKSSSSLQTVEECLFKNTKLTSKSINYCAGLDKPLRETSYIDSLLASDGNHRNLKNKYVDLKCLDVKILLHCNLSY